MAVNEFDISKFDSNCNYAIEASAGTGKTYNIVEIFKKLVVDEKIDFNKILVVTYTEKAVGELKHRIREELGIDTDLAPIFTIHSFCRNTIMEHGITADLPLDMGMVGESELRDFAKRFVRKKEIVEELASLGTSPEGLVEALVQGIGKYYLNNSWKEEDTIINLADLEISKAPLEEPYITISSSSSFDEMCKNNADIKRHYEALRSSSVEKERVLAQILKDNALNGFHFDGMTYRKNKAMTPDVQEAFLFFKAIKETLSKKQKNGSKWLASIHLAEFYKAWQEEKENLKAQAFDDMLRNVREAVKSGSGLLDVLRDKYRYGIIDECQDTNQKQFDIFEEIFLKDNNHHLIIVGDVKQSIYSFQGADVTVFRKACENVEKSASGVSCGLMKNWRSTKTMVESCNALFRQDDYFGSGFVESTYLDKTVDKYEHSANFKGKPAKAFWIAGSETKVKPYEFAKIAVQKIIECCELDSTGHTKLRIYNGKENQERDVSFKDFAVLARTSAEMRPIMSVLKNAGVPFIRYKDDSLFKGRECAHWVALLDAIYAVDFTGKNRDKLKRALFTSFFGLTLNEIESDKYNTDSAEEVIKINNWKQIAIERRWEELIDDIILNSGLTSNLKSLKEIQSLSIYKQLGEYCIDVLSSGHSLESLIRKLSNLAGGGSDDELGDDDGIIEKATEFDCVQVMTIHAAKGLEFPVVICAGGFKFPNHILQKAYIFHDSGDNDKAKLIFNKDADEKQKELIELEEKNEWKRLFYVAYTRAKYVLMLPVYDKFGDQFGKKSKATPFLWSSLIAMLDDTTAPEVERISDSGKEFSKLREASAKILERSEKKSGTSAYTKDSQDARMKDIIGNRSSQSSYKHSYSSLSHGNESTVPKDPDDDSLDKEGSVLGGLSAYDKLGKQVFCSYDPVANPVVFPGDYPRGTVIGTALHEIFEVLDYQNYAHGIDDVIKRCFEKQRLAAVTDWIKATGDMVDNVLLARLPEIKGKEKTGSDFTLNSIPSEDLKRETEFNFNVFGQHLGNYCNGFIDLLFRRGEYYSILDWKSDRLNEDFTSYTDGSKLKKHVDAHYSIQRVLYSYCLIKWLKQFYNMSEEDIFEKHFGGVYYVFLRGCCRDTGNGIFCQTWNSWDDLKESFNNIIHSGKGEK